MLSSLCAHTPARGSDRLVEALQQHAESVAASFGGGDRAVVREVEAEVARDPANTIRFDGRARATVTAAGRTLKAGRFEIPMLWSLRSRAAEAPADGALRLLTLYGEHAVTDVGALQAFCDDGTLFQVASQFNCLESPGPYITPVANYFSDPTQGPRASVSAFAGTLVRHYAAPSTDGRRFTQRSDGEQIDLLADVCPREVASVRNGYLRSAYIDDPAALVEALEHRFEALRVGVHDGVEVSLGANWDGAVPTAHTVAQVFTSTLAAGMYGAGAGEGSALYDVCRYLLRGAYLGTLLAARALGHRTAVLTLIGGGVFGNPTGLIWESILWACDEVARVAPGALDVVVNGRALASAVDPDVLHAESSARGGFTVALPRSGDFEVR